MIAMLPLTNLDEAKTQRVSKFTRLVETLKREGITFCHWKSNFYLEEALAAGGELDLLVERRDAQRFEGVLLALGFKPVIDPARVPTPSVLHFYGLEHETGALLHLHVYFRVVTGESLLKNFHLPIEAMLLQNLRYLGDMPIPCASAELIVFVVRAMLKHTTPLEYFLLWRQGRTGYQALRQELAALLADVALSDSLRLLTEWLPPVSPDLFRQCVEALQMDAPIIQRLWLALRLRGQLNMYNRFSPLAALFHISLLLFRRVIRRLQRVGRSKQLAAGGAVIAFVGPEATGKSTLVKETARWLGKVFDVRAAHLGKPPATLLTFAVNLVAPLVRYLAPTHRPSRIKNNPDSSLESRPSLLYAVRAVLVAWDRRALAIKLHRLAANGTLIICDRYPSTTVGMMDSARLSVSGGSRLIHHLAHLENQLYRQIPAPDVVIQLSVPLEVAMERNRGRQKTEDAAYLTRRHTSGIVPVFPTARTVELDSNQPQSQTIRRVRQLVWDVL